MILFLLGCSPADNVSTPAPAPSAVAAPAGWANVAPARVLEAHHGDGRSYLQIEEASYTFWVSVPQLAVAAGDFVQMGKGSLHEKLHSAELARDFERITEIDRAEKADAGAVSEVLVPIEGGVSVADLYARRTEFGGKEVRVRGRVVKASKGIFGKNWYHLRDGSGVEGSNDLTVTTTADANLGDVLVATGPLTLDRDLGFGYFFAVILEDAAVVADGAAGAAAPAASAVHLPEVPAAPALPEAAPAPAVATPKKAGLPSSPLKQVFGIDVGATTQAQLDAWAVSRLLTCTVTASPRRATTHTRCGGDIAPSVLEGRKMQGKVQDLLFSRTDTGPIHAVSATSRYSLPSSAAEDYQSTLARLVEQLGRPSIERPYEAARLEQKLVRFAAEWNFNDLDVAVSLYRTGVDYYTLAESWAVPGVEASVSVREGSIGHGAGPLRPPGWNPHVAE